MTDEEIHLASGFHLAGFPQSYQIDVGFGGSDICQDDAGILREFFPDRGEGRLGEIGRERAARGGAEDSESEVSNVGLAQYVHSVCSQRTYPGHSRSKLEHLQNFIIVTLS